MNTRYRLHALYKSLPRYVIIVIAASQLCACITNPSIGSKINNPSCYTREYCVERDGPRQYTRAPDGWGGKYCLANPTEC